MLERRKDEETCYGFLVLLSFSSFSVDEGVHYLREKLLREKPVPDVITYME